MSFIRSVLYRRFHCSHLHTSLLPSPAESAVCACAPGVGVQRGASAGGNVAPQQRGGAAAEGRRGVAALTTASSSLRHQHTHHSSNVTRTVTHTHTHSRQLDIAHCYVTYYTTQITQTCLLIDDMYNISHASLWWYIIIIYNSKC